MRSSPVVLAILLGILGIGGGHRALAQVPPSVPPVPSPAVPPPDDPPPPPPGELPDALPEPPDPKSIDDADVVLDGDSVNALLRRLEKLEEEVEDVRALRERVSELESELDAFKGGEVEDGPEPGDDPASMTVEPGPLIPEDWRHRSLHHLFAEHGRRAGVGMKEASRGNGGRGNGNGNGNGGNGNGDEEEEDDPTAGYSRSSGEGTVSAGGGGGSGPNSGGGRGSIGRGERVGERQPLRIDLKPEYKYNFAGGFLQFADEDGEFVFNVQNILTADGTFYDRQNPPTEVLGFNIPFQRLYLYGNITKNWEFQVSEQSSYGNINLL
jgi:hypothetical protein